MRFHLLMLIIVILVSLGMHGLAMAAARPMHGTPASAQSDPIPPAGA